MSPNNRAGHQQLQVRTGVLSSTDYLYWFGEGMIFLQYLVPGIHGGAAPEILMLYIHIYVKAMCNLIGSIVIHRVDYFQNARSARFFRGGYTRAPSSQFENVQLPIYDRAHDYVTYTRCTSFEFVESSVSWRSAGQMPQQ